MPSNDENVAMACTALVEAITHTHNMPPDQYYLLDTDIFIVSLTKITGTVQIAVKSAACAIMQHKYNLKLDI